MALDFRFPQAHKSASDFRDQTAFLADNAPERNSAPGLQLFGLTVYLQQQLEEYPERLRLLHHIGRVDLFLYRPISRVSLQYDRQKQLRLLPLLRVLEFLPIRRSEEHTSELQSRPHL